MTDETKPRRGRPPLPPHERARFAPLATYVTEELVAAVKAEADRRGVPYSRLIKSFIVSGMAALGEQRAA